MGFFTEILAQKIEKQEVDSLWWKKKTEQLDYAEEQLQPKDFNFDIEALPTWFNAPVFKYGILLLIVLVLLFVLYKLFGKAIFVNDMDDDKSATHLLTESDLDDRFYEMDLDMMLKKSIGREDWAMAIRIRFLMVLKLLIDQKQIYWHKDLTNRQIAWQLKPNKSRKDFYQLVEQFEKVWYGDISISANDYHKISSLFKNYRAV